MTNQPGRVRRLMQRNSTRASPIPTIDQPAARPTGRAAPAPLGPMAARILSSPSTSEAHELGRTFLEIAENGFIEDYEQLLADSVVYLVSGRSHMAGLHQGKDAVLVALATPPAVDVTVIECVATELMATGTRAIAVARVDGHIRGRPFTMEVVFHLQCAAGQIVAITEYSSDQYLADRLVARIAPPHRQRNLANGTSSEAQNR